VEKNSKGSGFALRMCINTAPIATLDASVVKVSGVSNLEN